MLVSDFYNPMEFVLSGFYVGGFPQPGDGLLLLLSGSNFAQDALPQHQADLFEGLNPILPRACESKEFHLQRAGLLF